MSDQDITGSKPEAPRPKYPTAREALEAVCTVEFVKGSGPGGQHRNTRETGVRLVHPPSGISIVCTERRSQHMNLEAAYERLTRRLEALNHRQKKRIPTRVSRAKKRKRVEDKRKLGEKKAQRKKPSRSDW